MKLVFALVAFASACPIPPPSHVVNTPIKVAESPRTVILHADSEHVSSDSQKDTDRFEKWIWQAYWKHLERNPVLESTKQSIVEVPSIPEFEVGWLNFDEKAEEMISLKVGSKTE